MKMISIYKQPVLVPQARPPTALGRRPRDADVRLAGSP